MVLTTLKTPSCHRTNFHTESGPHYCIPLYRYSCHKHTFQASTLTTLQYSCSPLPWYAVYSLTVLNAFQYRILAKFNYVERGLRSIMQAWVATWNSHVCNFLTKPRGTMWTKTIPTQKALTTRRLHEWKIMLCKKLHGEEGGRVFARSRHACHINI